VASEGKTTAQRIRGFFRELFRSEYTRFLEQELVRQRMDYDARIRSLIAEKLELVQKIDRLEIVIAPQLNRTARSVLDEKFSRTMQSTAEMVPPSSWQQALEEHARRMEVEDKANST